MLPRAMFKKPAEPPKQQARCKNWQLIGADKVQLPARFTLPAADLSPFICEHKPELFILRASQLAIASSLQHSMSTTRSSGFSELTEAELRKVLHDMRLWEEDTPSGDTATLFHDLDCSIAELHGMSFETVPLGSLDPCTMNRSARLSSARKIVSCKVDF